MIATCQCALVIIIAIPLQCLTLSSLFGLIGTPCTEPGAQAAGILQESEVGQENTWLQKAKATGLTAQA